MSVWPKQRLEELTTKIGSGATPRGGATVYTTTGVALIRSQNVLDNSMKVEDIARVGPEAAVALSGVAVATGDVLLNITGDSVARCALVNPGLLPARVNQHVAIIRTGPTLDSRFLQRFLVNPSVKEHLLSIATSGGTRNALTKSQIGALEVSVPPIAEQRAIAEVLGALDDKITANSKLAQNALSLADTTFEAAVRAVVMSDHTFETLATVSGGGTPSTKVDEYWNGAVAWATPTDVTGLPGPYLTATSRKITSEGLQACASKLFEPGAILMTSRATIGAFAINEVPTAVNQGFIVVEPNESVLRYWLLHEMRSRVPEFLSWANGATFLELSRGKFKKLPVRLPSDGRLAHFDASVAPLHGVASAAHSESRTLAATRDALLPHLMSGRLTVGDAEKTVEDLI